MCLENLLIIGIVFVLSLILWINFRKGKRLTVTEKAIFITGCDSGIGLEVAKHLYLAGFIVICGCLDLKSNGALLLKNHDSKSKGKLYVIQTDVTNEESVSSAKQKVSNILQSYGLKGLWSIINNAGVCIYGEFDWLTLGQCHNQINVNLVGTIRIVKSFLDLVINVKGRIIFVGSINGNCAYPGIAVYSATKYAVEGFSEALRAELYKFGVDVVLIKPGDFARLTNIMQNHENNVKDMWSNMNPTKQSRYKEYIRKYNQIVMQNYGVYSPLSFKNSTLLTTFEDAVVLEHPNPCITIAPLELRLFIKVLRALPISTKNLFLRLIYKFVFKLNENNYFK